MNQPRHEQFSGLAAIEAPHFYAGVIVHRDQIIKAPPLLQYMRPSMKIGMIVHAYYLKDARVRRYAELLAAQGHEVDVLCLREGDEPRASHHLGVNIHRISTARLRAGRLSYVYEYFSSFVRFFAK